MQSVVRCHLNRLIGCSNDVRTEKKGGQNDVLAKPNHVLTVWGNIRDAGGDSPFVILAGESSINKLSDGSRVTNIVYYNNQRQLSSTFSVNLVCQVGKIQLQLLSKEKRNYIFAEKQSEQDHSLDGPRQKIS